MIIQLTIIFPETETKSVSGKDYEDLYSYDADEPWWNR